MLQDARGRSLHASLAHERPFALDAGAPALGLDLVEGLACRGVADAVPADQLVLGRDSHPGPQLAAADPLDNLPTDPVVFGNDLALCVHGYTTT